MKPIAPELAAAVKLLQSLIPADCEECSLSVRADGRATIEVSDAMFRGVRSAKLDILESGEVVRLEPKPVYGFEGAVFRDGGETLDELFTSKR